MRKPQIALFIQFGNPSLYCTYPHVCFVGWGAHRYGFHPLLVRYSFSLYNLLIWGADYTHTIAYDHHLGMRQLKLLAVRCLIRMTQHDSSQLQSPPIQSISWADEFHSRSTTPFSCFSILEFASKGLEISSHLNIMTIMTLLSSDKIKIATSSLF